MRLESLTFSHYVERVRWCLDLLSEEYHEEHNIGLLGLFLQGRTVPILHVPASRTSVGDSSAILRFLYAKSLGTANEERAAFLRPTAETLATEERLCDVLGNKSRRWMYYHVLKSREVTLQIWGANEPNVPLWQRMLLRVICPLLVAFVKTMLKVNKSAAERCLAETKALFAELDEVFADGRSFLFGDVMTSADITLASLGYIAVWQENTTGGAAKCGVPALGSLPSALQDFSKDVRALRATPTGQFINRMYQRHRLRDGNNK